MGTGAGQPGNLGVRVHRRSAIAASLRRGRPVVTLCTGGSPSHYLLRTSKGGIALPYCDPRKGASEARRATGCAGVVKVRQFRHPAFIEKEYANTKRAFCDN